MNHSFDINLPKIIYKSTSIHDSKFLEAFHSYKNMDNVFNRKFSIPLNKILGNITSNTNFLTFYQNFAHVCLHYMLFFSLHVIFYMLLIHLYPIYFLFFFVIEDGMLKATETNLNKVYSDIFNALLKF